MLHSQLYLLTQIHLIIEVLNNFTFQLHNIKFANKYVNKEHMGDILFKKIIKFTIILYFFGKYCGILTYFNVYLDRITQKTAFILL